MKSFPWFIEKIGVGALSRAHASLPSSLRPSSSTNMGSVDLELTFDLRTRTRGFLLVK